MRHNRKKKQSKPKSQNQKSKVTLNQVTGETTVTSRRELLLPLAPQGPMLPLGGTTVTPQRELSYPSQTTEKLKIDQEGNKRPSTSV